MEEMVRQKPSSIDFVLCAKISDAKILTLVDCTLIESVPLDLDLVDLVVRCHNRIIIVQRQLYLKNVLKQNIYFCKIWPVNNLCSFRKINHVGYHNAPFQKGERKIRHHHSLKSTFKLVIKMCEFFKKRTTSAHLN